MNYSSVGDLVAAYPKIENRLGLEAMLLDIGLERIGYQQIRDKYNDFAIDYGINPKEQSVKENDSSKPSGDMPRTGGEKPSEKGSPAPVSSENKNSDENRCELPKDGKDKNPRSPDFPTKPKSTQLGTPRYVKTTLKKFNPRGNRQKVVAIKVEMCQLNIEKTPMAFCFLLRSAFEISAKEYCKDNNISIEKTKKGIVQNKTLAELLTLAALLYTLWGIVQNKTLAELLREIVNHLTENGKNKGLEKEFHGALTEITKSEGILSVTSMNQLVHGTTFSIPSNDICIIFGNIFPLLEAMN